MNKIYRYALYEQCKYASKEKDYIRCKRDGSIRKNGCPCPAFERTMWNKFLEYLGRLFK